ncbi:MAG TPA: SH3 domain-containing protein, partial [Thermoanaerobaculia bacterium]|nr:SH3 domain-containing protein [Thermoanaerobaculia bacterium]
VLLGAPPGQGAAEPEPPPAPHAPDERPTYVVKNDKTQLRDEPTTKSAVLGRLAKSTRVTGLEEKDGWVFVRLPDNRVGWIRADLLRKEGP